MHFLFVVLMSVLVGASALPHVMQAPTRPSFSLRKNTSFSIVAIPKLFQTVASLKRKIASLEEEQSRKKSLFEKNKKSENDNLNFEIVSEEEGTEEAALQESSELSNSSESLRPKGTLLIENVDLQSCICKEQGVMDCKLSLEGSCSPADEFVSVTVELEGNETVKSFRCKEENQFSGTVSVNGGSVAILKVNFMDQQYEQNLNMINYCGQLEKPGSPSDDE